MTLLEITAVWDEAYKQGYFDAHISGQAQRPQETWENSESAKAWDQGLPHEELVP